MSKDRKEIKIIFGLWEDIKSVIFTILVIAFIVIVGIVLLIGEVLKLIWLVIKWGTSPLWYPFYRTVELWQDYSWEVSIVFVVVIVAIIFCLVKVKLMVEDGKKVIDNTYTHIALISLVILIALLIPSLTDSVMDEMDVLKNVRPDYKADYIIKSYTKNDNASYQKETFSPNEKIQLYVKFNSSKGYIYDRKYPEDNIIVYLVYADKKKGKDSYAPVRTDELGFFCKKKGLGLIQAEYYKYLTLNSVAGEGLIDYWTIKDSGQYLKPGKWKIYLFIMSPRVYYGEMIVPAWQGGLKKPSIRFRDRRVTNRDTIGDDLAATFRHESHIIYKNRKRFHKDELAVVLTIKVKE